MYTGIMYFVLIMAVIGFAVFGYAQALKSLSKRNFFMFNSWCIITSIIVCLGVGLIIVLLHGIYQIF